MSKRWLQVLLGLAVAAAMLVAYLVWGKQQSPVGAGAVLSGEIALPTEGFARAEGKRVFTFPRDHGPHPEFQTEWWYYTGNLTGEAGQRYGYQLTFFRRAMVSPQDTPERTSSWAASQVYMAHFAVTDANRDQFKSFERLERGAAGLAGAKGDPLFQVWLEDWSITQLEDGSFRLQASQGDLGLDLSLEERKPPILQGDEGYSQKGPQPGNASYYYSLTHLETTGAITLGDSASVEVNGLSWMDHEFSTSALSHGQIGWDWFALQLSDGSELMVFNLRQSDGTPGPFSSGSYITADGRKTILSREDFSITPLDTWESSQSGARYPSGWRVDIPGQELSITVSPLIRDQENRLTFTYWEGAVDMTGSQAGRAVSGSGYVELTGYAASFEGEF